MAQTEELVKKQNAVVAESLSTLKEDFEVSFEQNEDGEYEANAKRGRISTKGARMKTAEAVDAYVEAAEGSSEPEAKVEFAKKFAAYLRDYKNKELAVKINSPERDD